MLIIFLVLIIILISGIVFELLARIILGKQIYIQRTFVSVSGKNLHYVKSGVGDCTVIFVSGLGSSHAIWKDIQDEVSKSTVTLSYDRNGIMFSDNNPQVKVTIDDVSNELTQLLSKTNCPKPYIIVAHSMAGIYLRPFISDQINNILSVIFVEATHPEQIVKSSEKLKRLLKVPPFWLVKLLVTSGFYRTFFLLFPLSIEIPKKHRLTTIERNFFYKSYKKIFEELKNDSSNMVASKKYTSFGNLRLCIIVGTSNIRYNHIKDYAVASEYKKLLNSLQNDLLKLSINSRLRNATNSGHLVQINDGQLIIDEINADLQQLNLT